MHTKATFITLAFVAWTSNAPAQALMIPLGDLPGGGFFSVPRALSGDGMFAVGHSSSSSSFLSSSAFVWSGSTGMAPLGQVFGSDSASGVSSDGRYIVGDTFNSSGSFGVLWEPSGSIHLIPDIPGGNHVSTAADVSDTGVVVGSSQYGAGPFGPVSQAIRWTVDGGLEPLGFLNEGDINSVAYAISADGSVIAGRGSSGNWMWTEEDGMIPTAVIEFESQGMTNDAAFIYGVTQSVVDGRNVSVGAIWSESTGMLELAYGEVPPTWTGSVARDASLNADVILGMRYAIAGGGKPYIWFEQGATGMLLEDYLFANGLDVGEMGYQMLEVAGISDDGTRFLIETFNPEGNREAVLVIVPAPGTGAVVLAAGALALKRRR